MESSPACRPHYKCQGEPELKIPSPRGGPHASRMQFPWSAPRTAPAGRAHALLARGLPIIIIIIALAALVLSSVGHAQTLDPVLVSNTGQTAGSDLATATDRVSYAQSFTTGDHPDGYFLSSVEVGLKADSGVTAEVALWQTTRTTSFQRIGYFFLPNHILTTLSGVASIDDDAATLERFSANDVLLLPGTTYWIVVTRTGGADDGLSVATTSSEDAVDAGGMAGFSVGNNVWVPDPDHDHGWADYSGSVDASMKIGLRGSEATRPPGPYATNRNERSRAAAAETSSSTTRYATSFTTASNPDTHQLTSVLLGVAAEAGVSPRVAIHADASGGQPAASALTNGTLTAPADVSRVLGAPDRAEFTASTAISLAGGTRYWVVLDVGSGTGSLSVSTTASDVNDEIPQPQWSIGDTMKAYSGTSWSNDSLGRTFRMALNGPTDQYTGPPFQFLREVRIGLPQVGVVVAAEIYDESFRIKNATWQWQRGDTSDGTFTDIPAAQGGRSRVYVPAAADLGKWLKVLVSYENAFGPGKMLSGVSGNAVLSQPIISNAGQISDLGYTLQEPTVNIAQAFTTGGNPSGYSLSGLRFGIAIDTVVDALSWALHADNAGEPAAEPLFAHIAVPPDSLDDDKTIFEDLVHPGFPLAPDTKYWAVLTASPLMEGTGEPDLGVAGISEFGDRVILDGPAAELDPGSESGWTLDFSTLVSVEDPMSTEDWVPFTEAIMLTNNSKLVLRMSVLTHPEVTASFGQAAHTVAEGATQSVTVTLSADPERTVTIPIVTMGQDGATDADYSGVPDSVTFNAGGPTEQTFTFTAVQDTVDDEGESVLLGFGSDLSGGVSAGTPDETTLAITDDDPPEVSFGESAYTVAEGGMVSVEVKLTSALGSAVTVPVTHTPQSATSSDDYSGVPANVMFSAGETSKAFTFTATQDTVDDDGESVLLTFGTLPATVQTGTTTQTTVNITDDDDAAAGKVTLELTPATINESGTGNASTVTASVPSASSAATTVTVSVNPTDTTTLTGNTTLSIPAGDTNSTGVVTITAVNDDAYTGNRTVAVSGTAVNSVGITDPDDVTLTITDDDVPAGCESGDILCSTVVEYADRFPSDAAGRKPLHWYHMDHDDQDMLEFTHKGIRYKVYTSSLGPNPGGGTYVRPPFHIPERSTARIGLGNLSATDPMGHWEMPNQDYLDWTLYISTNQDGATLEAKLPFNEAKFCCGHKWRWYGLDLYELNVAWAAGKEYQLRIVQDPRADRTPEVLGLPLYLEAGVGRHYALVHWVRPQVRNDGAPPGVRYKVQWKAAAGEWGTATVSEHVYVPLPGKEVLSWRISGLTPGSAYDVRVIAVNEAGDSAPSNVLRVDTDQAFLTSQNQAVNSPATGGPGIIGNVWAGETLTATTSGIEDEDGLADADFAYQWIRQDLATLNDTDIEGAISSTYTVTADDEGKAMQVRVTFTDDAGNPESVTSDAMAVAVGLRIGSATLDGARLTLTYNDTLDSFVTLPPAAFTVSVNGGFRSVNAVSVAGASVTLTLASAAQAGDTVTVDYAKPNGPDFIRDTQGRVAASFSGRAVSNDTPPPALTAAIHGAPESHDGQEDFTFELRFSEEPKTGFSDETLRADAFTVTGGEVVGARQLDPPGKVSWEISVSPASSGDVNVVLPVTEDCDADVAICTDDGTMLSSPLEFTVSGPTSEQTSQQRQENTAAMGSPTISGTVQVGQTLAASTTGITDSDGTTNASYSHQWIANDGTSDSDIADATVSTYTLVAGDAGKMIKVRVTFTDDGGNEETLTSVATVAVAPTVPGAPGILSVSVNDTGKLDVSWDAPDSNGGSAVTGYKVQWKESSDSWDTPAEVSETTVTGTSHTVTGLTDGVEYTFRVFAVNTVGDSSASDDASGTPRETTAPTVSSATVDGATLTLTFSEGLTETPLPAVTTFTVNVGDNRRGVDSVAISGSTVTLTLASAATSTDAVSAGYTVPSDAAAARLKDLSDNPAESFTGQVVTNNTAAAPPPLTASIHDEPSSHDGQSEFTFELQFSEEPKSGFSYKTMRDHVFTVTGGSATGARRLKSPSNVGWQINVVPDSNGDVTIVLPITEDCDAQGAICTGDGDGRPLSNRLEITVSGPTG